MKKENEPIAASLSEQIGAAQKRLAELQAEKDGLPAEIQRAAQVPDPEALVRARQRLGEIDVYILSENIRLARLKNHDLDAQLPEAQAKIDRQIEQAIPTRERSEQALSELRQAENEIAYARAEYSNLRESKRENQRWLDNLMMEAQQQPARQRAA